MTIETTKPATDGRRLRSEQTRRNIVDAYVDLVRKYHRSPTAKQIADHAGYSVRSVFDHFPDLAALSVAAADMAFARARGRTVLRNVNAARAVRIRRVVEMHARTCEEWLPLWRTLNAGKDGSPELGARLTLAREALWQRMEIMFHPELATLDSEQRRGVLFALEAITDFESWGRMRANNRLRAEQACEVWAHAIDRLLPPSLPGGRPGANAARAE